MRVLALCLLSAGLLVGIASAAAIDPEALVIRVTDVPAGYRLDRAESGTRTNAQEAKDSPQAAPLFSKWGRVTGHQRIFERGESSIKARADVFRSPSGARELLRFARREVRLAGIKGVPLRPVPVAIGDEGFLVEVRLRPVGYYVYWREGVVWSALGGEKLAKARVLALARVQQRRIVGELG